MKLRKPCVHGRYEEHVDIPERDPSDPIGTIRGPFFPCPGGVFLPDDTLIIEPETDEDGGRFWPHKTAKVVYDILAADLDNERDRLYLADIRSTTILDALLRHSLRERS